MTFCSSWRSGPRQGVYGFYGKVPRRELCVVGFEPNPSHLAKLSRAMEGWREKARVFHIFGAAILDNQFMRHSGATVPRSSETRQMRLYPVPYL